jgi:hypothetical protein
MQGNVHNTSKRSTFSCLGPTMNVSGIINIGPTEGLAQSISNIFTRDVSQCNQQFPYSNTPGALLHTAAP